MLLYLCIMATIYLKKYIDVWTYTDYNRWLCIKN